MTPSAEDVAIDLLKCALAQDAESRVIGNVRARDLARVAARCVTACPLCGCEPWVNIDCRVCIVVSQLEGDGYDRPC